MNNLFVQAYYDFFFTGFSFVIGFAVFVTSCRCTTMRVNIYFKYHRSLTKAEMNFNLPGKLRNWKEVDQHEL